MSDDATGRKICHVTVAMSHNEPLIIALDEKGGLWAKRVWFEQSQGVKHDKWVRIYGPA
jgi:hypothetical protein